jgi:hypothetical protein
MLDARGKCKKREKRLEKGWASMFVLTRADQERVENSEPGRLIDPSRVGIGSNKREKNTGLARFVPSRTAEHSLSDPETGTCVSSIAPDRL